LTLAARRDSQIIDSRKALDNPKNSAIGNPNFELIAFVSVLYKSHSSPTSARDRPWAYCGFPILQLGIPKAFWGANALNNFLAGGAMALMRIGSLYLCARRFKLGGWGAILGWPVLISVSIGVGVVSGFFGRRVETRVQSRRSDA
jgi:hypothetical protein